MIEVLGIVLAGGRGDRLYPLTRDRAKPAVPFGGKYRIIDFVLSNFINSGIYSVYVLTQFKAQSLIEHLELSWRLSDFFGERFITPVPAQMRVGKEWYQGTADAVYQNLYLLERHHPQMVAVFGADHVYRMNLRQMKEAHRDVEAEATVAVLPVKIEEAHQFGVIQVDQDWCIVGFEEKPEKPRPIPGEPGYALVSIGNYFFNTDVLIQALGEDAVIQTSSHDFGRDLLPGMINKKKVYAYDFRRNSLPFFQEGEKASYWRDLGTIDAYYEASMDLRSVDPALNLYNPSWPIRTVGYGDPPAKFVFDWQERRGIAENSLVGEGTIISGSVVRNSIVSRNVRIHSYGLVEDSILLAWVEIGRGCRIRRTIIDKHNIIPPGTEIGYDLAKDRERYFVSENGIVVVPRSEPRSDWLRGSL
ncbi:MAG TPA: glucose-1-phosphate adenylyltransferase [Candidatus Binatia bacterium]